MSERREAGTLIRYEDAGTLIKEIDDERLRAFINYGLTTVLTRRRMKADSTPQGDFDLHFFAEVLRAMGEDRMTLLHIFQGDISEMEWWPEKD